jgi:membrane-bound lytic murein transglycosylase A
VTRYVTRYTALVRLEPQETPAFEDDLDTVSLHAAAFQSMSYYQSLPQENLYVLGSDTYTARDLFESMAALVTLLEDQPNRRDWLPMINKSFAVYQSVGVDSDKTVVFSSYYEPTIPARLAPDPIYKFPLYARPADLVDVNLSLFDPAYQGARVTGRLDGRGLVPYPTRADIDSRKILKDQGLEIAWAKDPLDILDLQIEGSGWLDFGKGNLKRVRYDGDNGRRYKSVGQYLIATGRIPAQKFSRQAYLRYLKRHPEERQELLNVNERYIFFRIDAGTTSLYAYGNIDVPLTPWRSIATDPKLFPKGALAWISVGETASLTPTLSLQGRGQGRPKGEPRVRDGRRSAIVQRFMVNQDEGWAIQGPGRVDIFVGHGKKSKAFATHMWNKGHLYFLVKKKDAQ